MKGAIGGTILFQMMMLFVVIYMALLALGINYAVTFRVKNQIVNILENNSGYENAAPKIEEYLSSVSYYGGKRTTSLSKGDGSKCLNGTSNYCVEKIELTSGGYYYVVTTFVNLDLPMVGKINELPVKGETSVMGRLKNK